MLQVRAWGAKKFVSQYNPNITLILPNIAPNLVHCQDFVLRLICFLLEEVSRGQALWDLDQV